MNADHSASATFVLLEQLSVTKSGNGTASVISTPAGISCGSTCAHSYNYGTSVQLRATPVTGWSFVGWTGGGCSGTDTCTVSMTQARSVTATFALIRETLNVTKSGKGSVTSSPAGISCGATCAHSYNYGMSVQLYATPPTGWSFARWTGGSCSGTGICIVSMTQARTVTATFIARSPASLKVSRSGGGSGVVTSSLSGISCGSTCSHAYSFGTSVTLTARTTSGSAFTGWSGACAGTSAKCQVSMTAARTTTATFAAPRAGG
jgi:hypothetical protein